MPLWETCEIKEVRLQDMKSGLFKKPEIRRWETCKVTKAGEELIDYSEPYESDVSLSSLNYKPEMVKEAKLNRKVLYQQLIERLMNEGWEIATTAPWGDISMMRRQVGSSTSALSKTLTDLINQLANLREAGLLTEQDFQTKKVEVLKRM